MREADLSEANLCFALLKLANLSEATLDAADCSEADLTKADLSTATLLKSTFCRADLCKASLRSVLASSADFREAKLTLADFDFAEARQVNFSDAELINIRAISTTFEDSIFTGACLKNLNTNRATNFRGAEAEYFYFDIEDRQFSDRRPHSGNFKPGEFAALFQQALDTLDLIFVDGIDWQTFFASFQELRQQYGDAELNIQAIEKKSGGSFVVKLEVNEQADKTAIEQSAKAIYEENQHLKAQLFRTEGKLEGYKEQLSDFQQKVWQGMSDKTVINNNMQGATVGNMANQLSGNASQVYNAAQDKSLAEAAQEIQALLDQLSETYPTETRREKFDLAEVAAEQAKANLTLWQRIVSAIDAGTIGAVGEMLSHPVATFFIDAAQDLAETKPQA